MCHLGNLPVFVHEGGGPAVRTLSHCIVVGNRCLFFFLMANYIEIRPPHTPTKVCVRVCVCFLLDSCSFLERKPKSKLKF